MLSHDPLEASAMKGPCGHLFPAHCAVFPILGLCSDLRGQVYDHRGGWAHEGTRDLSAVQGALSHPGWRPSPTLQASCQLPVVSRGPVVQPGGGVPPPLDICLQPLLFTRTSSLPKTPERTLSSQPLGSEQPGEAATGAACRGQSRDGDRAGHSFWKCLQGDVGGGQLGVPSCGRTLSGPRWGLGGRSGGVCGGRRRRASVRSRGVVGSG